MTDDIVSKIKDTVKIREFVESCGIPVNRNGFCCCPFHGEKTASLRIYDKTDSWYCFGCHSGGDVLAFARLYYKVSFPETVKMLAQQYDIDCNNKTDIKSAVNKAVLEMQRKKKARRIEQLEIEYWTYYESWLDADQKAVDLAPKTMYDDFTQSWSEAVIKRESLKETLDWLDFKRRAIINGQ